MSGADKSELANKPLTKRSGSLAPGVTRTEYDATMSYLMGSGSVSAVRKAQLKNTEKTENFTGNDQDDDGFQ